MSLRVECLSALTTTAEMVYVGVLCRHIILVGQDKRELGALVFPAEEFLAQNTSSTDHSSGSSSSNSNNNQLPASPLEDVLYAEVVRLNSARPDYHSEDRITHIKV